MPPPLNFPGINTLLGASKKAAHSVLETVTYVDMTHVVKSILQV